MYTGDRIQASITLNVEDENSASLYLFNERNGDVAGPRSIDVKKRLPGDHVGWFVVAPQPPRLKLANFARVDFKEIRAVDFSGNVYDLENANYYELVDIMQERCILAHTTFCDITNTLSITYY